MASEMGWKSGVLLLLFLGLTKGHVQIVGDWLPNYGWAVKCFWQTFKDDRLQSVRLFRNGVQYAIFRPEVNGLALEHDQNSKDFDMKIRCDISSLQGQKGECLTSVRLKTHATEDVYMCEMSGERPKFRLEKEEYDAYVPPSDAVVTRIDKNDLNDMLNCTSSGVPAPSLVWTIDGREIPADFADYHWNPTTKLWDSWSAFSLQNEGTNPLCTPLINTTSKQVISGKGGVVSGVVRLCATKIIAAVLLLLTFIS